jgi:histone deacetylase 1/2
MELTLFRCNVCLLPLLIMCVCCLLLFSRSCEIFEGLWEYCALVSGASLQGASMLADGSADCAINWGGGRHHGGYNKATGFCYVNDCILATLRLLKTFRRVLYLDIDVHHSDGVQRAFWTSDRVLHVSLHHLRPGFFPGTGKSSERGAGKGKGFTVNVPLAAGCGDYTFEAIFTATLNAALENFGEWALAGWYFLAQGSSDGMCHPRPAPDCIVIQCGADTLSRDPLG